MSGCQNRSHSCKQQHVKKLQQSQTKHALKATMIIEVNWSHASMDKVASIGSDHCWKLNFVFLTKLYIMCYSFFTIWNNICKGIIAKIVIQFFQFPFQCGHLSYFTSKNPLFFLFYWIDWCFLKTLDSLYFDYANNP